MGRLSEWGRAARAVGHGVCDALALHRVVASLRRSRQLRVALANCVVLNGALFLGSHLLWSYALLPALLFLYPDVALVRHVARALYLLCWLGPLWVLSTVLNSKWYREIASKFLKAEQAAGEGARAIADRLYGGVLLAVLLALASAAPLVPVLGPAVAFAASCWLTSYYAMEYRWSGVALEARLRQLETHWLYFLGYGAPMTALYTLFPYLVSVALFAVAFPLALINAMHAVPVRPRPAPDDSLPHELPIFYVPSAVALRLFRLVTGALGHARDHGHGHDKPLAPAKTL